MNSRNTEDTEKQHILIYAHYYEPLASTGAILMELAEGLLSQFRITVIAAVPSYLGRVEEKYKTKKYYYENINGVEVIRVHVPEFQKGHKISRIKNILVYFFRAVKATGKVQDVDFVIGISQPPILGGMLGVYGKWRHSAEVKGSRQSKYVYWVQDCNPEQIKAVGYFRFRPLLRLLEKLDTYSCSKADLVVVPARDMVGTIEKRFADHQGKKGSMAKTPEKMPEIKVINNWIDEKEIYPLTVDHPGVVAFKKKYGLEGKYIIMYSGNLGNYYSLPELLKVIKKFTAGTRVNNDAVELDYKKIQAGVARPNAEIQPNVTPQNKEVVFTFIGDGALKENMEAYVYDHHMENVIFIPYQDKDDLIYSLNAADVHWCINAKGIKGVSCPSKYYGIAAVGKPVLGIQEKGAEVRCVIEECAGGLVCEPGDYESIEKNLRWFIEHAGSDEVREMGKQNRQYLEKWLRKDKSIGKFRDALMGLGYSVDESANSGSTEDVRTEAGETRNEVRNQHSGRYQF